MLPHNTYLIVLFVVNREVIVGCVLSYSII